MDRSHQGKNVLITGGGRGTGAAIVRHLASQGDARKIGASARAVATVVADQGNLALFDRTFV